MVYRMGGGREKNADEGLYVISSRSSCRFEICDAAENSLTRSIAHNQQTLLLYVAQLPSKGNKPV